jgi:hypothetical protein
MSRDPAERERKLAEELGPLPSLDSVRPRTAKSAGAAILINAEGACMISVQAGDSAQTIGELLLRAIEQRNPTMHIIADSAVMPVLARVLDVETLAEQVVAACRQRMPR